MRLASPKSIRVLSAANRGLGMPANPGLRPTYVGVLERTGFADGVTPSAVPLVGYRPLKYFAIHC